MIKNKLALNLHTPNGVNAIFIDKELAFLLKKAGFVEIRLGLETTSQRLQKATGKKIENATLKKVIAWLKEVGFPANKIAVYLLMGLAGQSFEEIKDSIIYAHRLGVRVYLEEYSPVPGTVEFKRAGLSEDLDPLWHNNSVFPLYKGKENYLKFQKLKDLNHALNLAIDNCPKFRFA